MSEAAAKKLLAQWRRQGHGVWHITLIVEGYDQELTYLVPGTHPEKRAVGLARFLCANDLDEDIKFVHLKSVYKEPA